MASTRRAPHRIDEAVFSCPLGKTDQPLSFWMCGGRLFSARSLVAFVRCSVGCSMAAEIIINRRRQRCLYEWRLFPISRRVAGLTSAPCRSWRCMSRRAPSWAGWFWSKRLARSRSGKSYEVTGLCILNLRFRSKTCRPSPRLDVRSLAPYIFRSLNLPRLRFLLSYAAFVSGVSLQCGGSVSFVSAARATGRAAFCGGPGRLLRIQKGSRRQGCEHSGAQPTHATGLSASARPKDGQAQPRLTAGCCG